MHKLKKNNHEDCSLKGTQLIRFITPQPPPPLIFIIYLKTKAEPAFET
jgi:hypothetical protein